MLAARRRRGHTIVEVLIAGVLLLAILGLIVVPFLMLNTATVVGTSRIDNQRTLRHPLAAMVKDLEAGYGAVVYAADSSLNNSNGIAVYDTLGRTHWRLHYHLDGQRRLVREVFDATAGGAVAGSPFIVGRGISFMFIQPRYVNPAVAGTWLDYTLPVPNPTATTALPPCSNVPLPQRTLVMLHLVGFESPDQPPMDLGTSFYIRN